MYLLFDTITYPRTTEKPSTESLGGSISVRAILVFNLENFFLFLSILNISSSQNTSTNCVVSMLGVMFFLFRSELLRNLNYFFFVDLKAHMFLFTIFFS